ncbi:MAG: hypothetical protein WCO13_00735 [Bacteroidota bacterium]
MKKQILILCFTFIAITASSQDTLKVKKNLKEFIGFSLIDNYNFDNKLEKQGFNLKYEIFNDSINQSFIRELTYFNKDLVYFNIGGRFYSSKRYIKFFIEGSICFIDYYKRFNVGIGAKAGINIGHFNNFNTDFYIDFNLVTNNYNFFEVGLSFKFKNFLKD